LVILIDLVGLFLCQGYVCLSLRVLRLLFLKVPTSQSAAFVSAFLDFVMFKIFIVHCDANVKGDFLPKIPKY